MELKELIAAAAAAEQNGNRDEFAFLLTQILLTIPAADFIDIFKTADI